MFMYYIFKRIIMLKETWVLVKRFLIMSYLTQHDKLH